MSLSPAARTVADLVAVIPDFPEPGVTFRDLTPVFADARGLRVLAEALAEPFAGRFDAIAGLEARGFLIAAAAAVATGTGVLTVRKAGKLPRQTLREDYALEYGEAALEVHADQLPKGSRVLIVDDVLATGGTASAAARLCERAGWRVVGISLALELAALGGRSRLTPHETFALLSY